jgi:hypothetical protein
MTNVNLMFLFFLPALFCFTCTNSTSDFSSHYYDFPDDRFESNNSKETSAVIDSGYYDSLICYNDDWYKLIVPGNNAVSIRLDCNRYEYSIMMTLYNRQGDSLASSFYNHDCLNILQGNYGGDTIFLRVYSPFGDSVMLKRYALTIHFFPDDTFENNDDFISAKPLSPGTYDLLKCYNIDVFKMDRINKTLEVKVTYNTDSANLSCKISDSTGKIVRWAGELGQGKLFLRYDSDSIAKPYITVLCRNDLSGSSVERNYSLSVRLLTDDRFEPNDSYRMASKVPQTISVKDSLYIIDSLVYLNEDDFIVTIQADTFQAILMVSDTSQSLTMQIYQVTGDGYGSVSTYGTVSENGFYYTCVVPDAYYGTRTLNYFLSITGKPDGYTFYKLEIIPRFK